MASTMTREQLITAAQAAVADNLADFCHARMVEMEPNRRDGEIHPALVYIVVQNYRALEILGYVDRFVDRCRFWNVPVDTIIDADNLRRKQSNK